MMYKLTKQSDIDTKSKYGIDIDVYPNLENVGFVVVNTKEGHNQEFYDIKSSFNYYVIDGAGTFYLNEEPIEVVQGDFLSIPANTRIYYKGVMKLILITEPGWQAENEVEVRNKVW